MVTEKAISRELMGKIVDEVFDGAIEDASVIEEIYAAIKRHESALSTDAEPVAHPQFEARMRDAIRFTVRETLGFVNVEIVNELFNNVTAVINHCAPPAPSVAVKSLLDDVWNFAVEQAAAIADDCVHLTPDPGISIKTMLNKRANFHPESEAALSAQVQDMAGWQDISTAQNCVGSYLFCRLAWRNGNDICTGDGFRWNGRWFVVGTFYKGGRLDQCQYEMRQIEVQPTHWMESTSPPDTPPT